MPEEPKPTSLTQRTVAGARWSLASQGVRQALRVLTLITLTRLLAPRDFGLMSMALVVNGFIDLFRDMGTSTALIQRRELTQRLTSTTFWSNVTLGVSAALVTFAASPLIAGFYESPGLAPVVRLMALSLVIAGVGTVHQALLARDLAFRRLAMVDTVATLGGSVTAVAAAVGGAGVYSLVAGMLATSSLTTIGAWLASHWRPSFQFAIDDLLTIRRFTTNLVGFNILNYLTRNVDYLLIGKYLGAQNLGYYTLAYNLLLFPLQIFTYSVGRVTFPAYSSIQDDPGRIGRAYLRTTGFIASITFPLLFGLLLLCDAFVALVYGKTWSPAAPVIAVLIPVGMFQSIAALVGTIYNSRGRTDLQLKMEALTAVCVITAFWIGLHWGIVGVAVGYAIAEVALLGYPALAVPLRLIGLRVPDLWRTVWRPLLASMVMALTLLAARLLMSGKPGVVGFSLLVLLGAVVYLIVSVVINRRQVSEFIRLLRPARRREEIAVAGR